MKKKSNIQLNLTLAQKARRDQEIELYRRLLSLRPCKVHTLKNKYNRRKAKAEMRKLMVLGLVFMSVLMTSCDDVQLRGASVKDYEPSETNKLDSLYKHSVVYDASGHAYDLYENGWKYSDEYSFTLVHRPDCKRCFDMFD